MEDTFGSTNNFNQPLNNWDVGNVNHMGSMFLSSVYNQPLNNWDVSSVQMMDSMFAVCEFNQDISGWCVEHFSSAPLSFSFNAPLLEEYQPNWGEVCTLSLTDKAVQLFKLYPNPVEDKIHIVTNSLTVDLKLNILDVSGKIMYSQLLETMTTEIDLGFLNSGMNFLKISNADNMQITRFVKE